MDHLARARRVLAIEQREIQRLSDRLDDTFIRAVEILRETIERRGKIVVIGVGKSGHIGEKIAATLTSTGAPAVVLNSLNALHGDLGVVTDGDALLAFSYSGETDEMLAILPALSRFDIRIIAITGHPGSFLARNAHVHLDVNVETEACPLNLAPTSSTTAMLALGDALAMVLLEARGFKKEDFARYHPGGKLGRTLLLKVREIMRRGDQLAFVPPDATVSDALREMAKRRAGCAIIAGGDHRLKGIFTHGDFGRHFQADSDVLGKKVSDHMTRGPITIGADKLAAEVLHILEQHRIDDLVVVDENDTAIGLVDSQDLARFKLI